MVTCRIGKFIYQHPRPSCSKHCQLTNFISQEFFKSSGKHKISYLLLKKNMGDSTVQKFLTLMAPVSHLVDFLIQVKLKGHEGH